MPGQDIYPEPPDTDVALTQPLHLIWLIDVSNSMDEKWLIAFNQAIRQVLAELKAVFPPTPERPIYIRAICFADKVSWHIGPAPVSLDQVSWQNLHGQPGPVTAAAGAIRLLRKELMSGVIQNAGYRPVCILVTAGFTLASNRRYADAIRDLDNTDRGSQAVRLAVACGSRAERYTQALIRFTNQLPTAGFMQAADPDILDYCLKIATISAIHTSIFRGNSMRGNNFRRRSNYNQSHADQGGEQPAFQDGTDQIDRSASKTD